MPEIFSILRSLIDERCRGGERTCQFLLLGTASPDLLQQSSESLAGRICYLELTPFHPSELAAAPTAMETHWLRGGYPNSYSARHQDL